MTAEIASLAVIFAIVGLGSAMGFYAGARHKRGAGYKVDLEQWAVAGRGFGLLLTWLLMAGEIYTTFAFLGASGWAYSRGGPTLYILTYVTLAYVISFFFLPQIWSMGRRHALQTESDFFGKRYGSQSLAVLVSLVGVAVLIPYLQIQITGLGIIVAVASYDAIGRTPAMVFGVILVCAFVFASGMRAVARVSILKDILMIFSVAAVGIAVPRIYFGGVGAMFEKLAQAIPAHLVMPGATAHMGHAWYVSTVLLTALGFYMWPHTFGAVFTAKSGDTLRRNAVVMPLYTISLAFVFFVGFAATIIVPGLKDGDLSFLLVVRKTFPPWFLGLIGGAGALTAMVPAAIIILAAATLFAKNVYRPLFSPTMNDHQIARLARVMVVVLGAISLYFAVYNPATLVSLLLLGYAGATQFFPGVIFGLYWDRVTATGVLAGLLTGVFVTAVLVLSKNDPFRGINAGFLALCINFAVTVLVSLATRAQPNGFECQSE